MFAKKARKFYFERIENGEDNYNSFLIIKIISIAIS